MDKIDADTINELLSYFIENQEGLSPEFKKVLDDNFWELLEEKE
jgi:hypothetical protein